MFVDESAFISPPKWQVFIFAFSHPFHTLISEWTPILLMFIFVATSTSAFLLALKIGICLPRFHHERSSHPMMTTEIAQFISPVFFFYYSGVIFWSGVLSYQIILFVRREALTKCNAYTSIKAQDEWSCWTLMKSGSFVMCACLR